MALLSSFFFRLSAKMRALLESLTIRVVVLGWKLSRKSGMRASLAQEGFG